MKATEARITTATGQKSEEDAARLKGLITMYEGNDIVSSARLSVPVNGVRLHEAHHHPGRDKPSQWR